jgi:hypothetical protein
MEAIMAQLKSSVIGNLSGKLNNEVFRIMNGKNFVSVRPEHYKVKSVKLKKAQGNLSITVKLAKSITAVPALKGPWSSANLKGSNAYHKILTSNLVLVKEGSLTTENIISPPGLPLQISSLTLEDGLLVSTLVFPGSIEFSFPAEVYFLLYFGNYKKSIIVIPGNIQNPEPEGIYQVSIPLNLTQQKMLENDSHPIVYAAFAGKHSTGKHVYWSNTACFKIE